MPAIIAKVEGQGNGIKTVIVNMCDIARALNREAICKSPVKMSSVPLFIYLLQIPPSILALSWAHRPKLTRKMSGSLLTVHTMGKNCKTSSTDISKSLFSVSNAKIQKQN